MATRRDCIFYAVPVAILKNGNYHNVVGPELQAVKINTYVSGYHAYQEKWNPVIGESAS